MNSTKSPKPTKKPALESSRVSRKRPAKAVKDPNAPKRALSAFMLFSGAKRAEIRAQNPEFKLPEVAKELGKLWREITDEEKQKYQKEADASKRDYEKALKEYNNKK